MSVAPLPVYPPLTPAEAAEWNLTAAVEEALSESFDADWTSADGARAVIERLRADGYLEPSLRLQLVASALLAALKPFAEACAHLHPAIPNDGETLDGFKVSDFRAAYDAVQLAEEHQP